MPDQINVGSIVADLDVNSGRMVQGLANGRKALDAIQAELQQLDKDVAANAITAAAYQQRLQELGLAWNDLTARMKAAHDAVRVSNGGLDVMAAKMAQGASSTNAMSRGLMQLGYAADDIQYGFQAIVNNVAPAVQSLAQGFGMSAEASSKFGASAQIAAVAAYQLYLRWDEVREALGDTTPMQEAMRSLEGMSERLKQLQEDAANFSWGDRLAWTMGLNPDAGKAAQAAGLEPAVKQRQRAESIAKGMENDVTDDEQEAAKRWKDAVVDAGKIDSLAAKLARQDVARGDLGRFLSPEKGPLAAGLRGLAGFALSPLGPHAAGLAASAADIPDLPGQGSQRDEYNDLFARKKAGTLSDQEKSRLLDLEALARKKAVEDAKTRIGAAAHRPDEQRRIGDDIGGRQGDILAGRKHTKKEQAKAEEEADKAIKADEKAEADRVKANRTLNEAGKENERQGKIEQEKRDKEFLKDATEKAVKAIPDLDRQAAALVAKAGLERKDSREAFRPLYDKLMDARDVNREERERLAGKAAGGTLAEAEEPRLKDLQHENRLMVAENADVARDQVAKAKERINDHLAGIAPGDPRKLAEAQEKDRPASTSAVFSAADLAHRVQSAIVDKPTRHQTKVETQLDKVADYLKTIAEKPGLTYKIT